MRAPGAPRSLIEQLDPCTLDLLLIAASVFCADSLVLRGGDARPYFGDGWRRHFRFVVPVSDAALWSRVHDELVDTLNFLTGDLFTFVFVKGVPYRRRYASLGPANPPLVQADQVVLFSGGLDSLTGALETLASTDRKVVLVTHRSATKLATAQTELVRDLRRRFPGRIVWAPALGTLVGCNAKETTQRSRSFLYAALGYAAASIVGASHVHLFENGIVSLNLPIDRQVVGTMATRTTHPLFLLRMQALLSKVGTHAVTIDNPYEFMTKTEVVARLSSLGGTSLIANTTSCSAVRWRTREHPHCGCCSQCLDRRFAILAAGVAEYDPVDKYRVELLRGPRRDLHDRTMALDWYRHAARRLARMSQGEFMTAFAAEIADLVAAYPGRPEARVLADAFLMHRRHGETVRTVTERAVSENAGDVIDQSIPADSLLAVLLSSATEPDREETSFAPPVTVRAGGALPAMVDRGPGIFPLRLIVVAEGSRPTLRIIGLGDFKGAHLKLVLTLRPYHEADCGIPLDPADHRYIVAGDLGTKNTVWQHVNRCRESFARTYEVVMATGPSSHLVIEGRRQLGYRLDPEARFVADRSS